MSRKTNLFKLWTIAILSTLLVWSLFAFDLPSRLGFPDSSMETIFANYDGPNYLIISKCLYDTNCIRFNYSLPLPLEYYPAHLPGYPLLISLLNQFISGPWAMLMATLLGTLAMITFFYLLAESLFNSKKAFYLSLILLFFPSRLFTLRLVGAPETWFLATILASIFFFRQKKMLPAAIFAALTQSLKSPGILLFAAYGIVAILETLKTKSFISFLKFWPFVLVPVVVLSIFSLYSIQLHDFWAYFHSGDNFHLNPLPYTVFISNQSWINSIWLEEIIYIFIISLFSLFSLFQKYKKDILFIFPLVFALATLFVAHRDISRYISPVYPFILIAFEPLLTSKKSLFIFLVLLPAVILYAINFIIGNTAPIADWGPYY